MACSKKKKLALGGDPEKESPFNINRFMAGIAHVESRGGKYMKNPHSSASGLYGQLYNRIPANFLEEYGIDNRAEFISDTAAQNAYMRQVISGNMKNTPRKTNLYRDAVELEKEYKPQLGDKYSFRTDEIAALSHYLGRQGARKYLAGIRDGKPYTPPGVNKTPEEYLKLYNEGLPEMAKGGFMGIKKSHKGYCTPMTKSTCTPHRKALAKRLKPGGDLYKGKKKEDGGYIDPQVMGGNKIGGDSTLVGTPLDKMITVPSDYTGQARILAAAKAREDINSRRWANYTGRMVKFPGAVPQFPQGSEMDAKLEKMGISRDYINSYQPNNYTDVMSYEELPLSELGLGDWIKDNTQGIVGGLKAALGVGAMFIPGMQGAGIGLIGSGIGDIGAEITRDRAGDPYENQDALIEEQQLEQAKAAKTQQLITTANQNSNYGKDLMMREYGGFLKYKGQTHDGPSRGIPVDKQGNPSAASGNKPVALTEEGEIAWIQPGGETYVFSKELGHADEAQKIMNKYKIRLGKDFDGDDNLARNGMNYELNNLYKKAEAERIEVEGPELQFGGDPDFTYTDPNADMQLFDPNSEISGYLSYDPAKSTMIASGISGGLTALGNLAMAKWRKKPDQIDAVLTSPEQVSFEEQRIANRSRGDLSKAEARTTARRAGASKAEDIATANLAGAAIDRNIGEQNAALMSQERQINAQLGQQTRLSNQASRNQTRLYNAFRQDQFDRETNQYITSAFGALQGAASDMIGARKSADYLNVLAGRTGYQVMIDPNTGQKVLVPVEGYYDKYE